MGLKKEGITSLVREYKLEQAFRLLGFVDDMEGFYQSLDLYINTSLHEGLPMGILEAMSYGIPVIAPKCGGLPEIIDNGIDGFLIEGRNPKGFAKKCSNFSPIKNYIKRCVKLPGKKYMKNFQSI